MAREIAATEIHEYALEILVHDDLVDLSGLPCNRCLTEWEMVDIPIAEAAVSIAALKTMVCADCEAAEDDDEKAPPTE